jgi:hypothetical protein
MQYVNKKFFENERQTQFHEMFYVKYSCFHSTFQNENIKLTCETNMDETTLKPIKNMSSMMKYKIIHLMMNNCKYLSF